MKLENYLLTAAVLAVGFAFTSEGNWFRVAYGSLFLYCIVENYPLETGKGVEAASALLPSSSASNAFTSWAKPLWDWISAHQGPDTLIGVALVHAIERFLWHVVQSRKFPDWLKD